ncbi:hypothetical protein BGZ60DRAFT_167990 [Tricladium varicosporioides]|nr:hypothetical protein BGZ60DRAFT_167990 [Hymenoscyphus varicosporioides]
MANLVFPDETPAGSQILIGAKQPKCQNFQGNTQKSPTIEFIPAVDLSCEPLSHDFILFPSSKASSQGVCARIDNSSQCAASRICRISAKSALSSIISLEAEASDRSNAIITTMDRALIDFHGIGTWMEVLIAIVPDINEDADLHENLTLSGEGAIP